MTKEYHAKAVASATAFGDKIDEMLADLGSRGRPKVGLSYIYEEFRAYAGGFLEDPRLGQFITVFRDKVESHVKDIMEDAVQLGHDNAAEQTAIYGLRPPSKKRGFVRASEILLGVSTAMNIVDTQLNQVKLQLNIGNTDEEVVLGSTQSPRHLNQYTLIKELSGWLPALALLAWDRYVEHATTGPNPFLFQKQVVAMLDGRTTETCYGAHGQVANLGEPFILGGEFPGERMYPPFHYWCRSTVALVLASEVEDMLTDQMLLAALAAAKSRAILP